MSKKTVRLKGFRKWSWTGWYNWNEHIINILAYSLRYKSSKVLKHSLQTDRLCIYYLIFFSETKQTFNRSKAFWRKQWGWKVSESGHTTGMNILLTFLHTVWDINLARFEAFTQTDRLHIYYLIFFSETKQIFNHSKACRRKQWGWKVSESGHRQADTT